MQLTPDSLRQWYVYFQEKEMGPFRESDLSQKLATREIALSAYVFTEGMTDWALASDTPVLTMATVRDTPVPGAAPKAASPLATPAATAAPAPATTAAPITKEEPSQSSLSSILGASVSNATAVGGSSFSGTTGPAAQEPGNIHKMEAPATLEPKNEKTAGHHVKQPAFSENDPSQSTSSKIKSASAVVETKVRKKTSDKTVLATKRFALPKLALPKINGSNTFFIVPIILVAAIVGGYYYATHGGYIPYVSDFLGVVAPSSDSTTASKTHKKASKKSDIPVATNEPTATAVAPKTSETQNPADSTNAREINWPELQGFRKNQDSKSAPYRLASNTLGQDRPVLIGVVSPLLKGKYVRVAIFPQADRNLMAIPRLWDFHVPLIDGFFSVGPLSLDGEKLPPGRYNVLVQMGSNFLGDTSFEVGSWPTGTELTAKMAQLQKERLSLAERERSAIEAKMREVNAAIGQLKVYGRYANQGAKGAKEWKKLSKPWKEAFQKALNYQRSVLGGPMFYAKMQNSIYSFMLEILKVFEAHDLQSAANAKEVQKKYKKGLAQFWVDLSKEQNNLTGEIQILGQSAPAPLQIDIAVVKKQLGKKNDQN